MNKLRVLWTFFRLGAMNELAYRVNFFTQIFQAFLSLGLALGGLAVVFNQTDTLAGWYPTELTALVGVYLLVGGLINLMIQPSMQRFMEDIRQGTLDFMILKPEDAQFLISVRQIEIWKLIDVGLGLAVLVVALVQLGAQIGLLQALGFGIALLLNQEIRGRSFYRVIYYLPSIIPGIAASMVWLYLFQPEFGVINWVLGLVGIEGPRWLYDTETAKMVFVIMSLWGAGGNMLIFLAGLQGIPTELYEAAKLDGAVAWRLLRHITLPMLSPTLFFVLVTNLIASFQVFTNVYIMTDGGGGPANSTMMYVLHLYLVAFRQYRLGYASALAWVLFLILLGLTLLVFRSSSLWVYYESEVGGKRS